MIKTVAYSVEFEAVVFVNIVLLIKVVVFAVEFTVCNNLAVVVLVEAIVSEYTQLNIEMKISRLI